MFNKKNTSDEIMAVMEDKLTKNAIDKQAEAINKYAKAIEYLNEVAEIFDDIGLETEAEYTTRLLEVIAAKKKTKKSKPKAKKQSPATKGLDSAKMVENLKHKGWVFNADDANYMIDLHEDNNGADDKDTGYKKVVTEELVKNDSGHDHDCMCSGCGGMKKKNHGDDCCCMYCADHEVGMDHDMNMVSDGFDFEDES